MLLPLLLSLLVAEEEAGRAVYAREACWQCHVHAKDAFPQLTDARRAGPVIGAPGPARSAEWHLAHLYAPRATSAGSEMPSYSHLFAASPRAAAVEAFLARHDRDGDGVVTAKEHADFEGLDTGNGVVSRADAAPMPSPGALALVRYLGEGPLAPADGTPRSLPPGDREAAALRGRAAFLETCAGCHGERADGNGPAAAFFGDHPPRNFRRGDYKFRSTEGPAPLDHDLFRTIRRGAGPSMPPWPQLSDAQVWDLVAYLQALNPSFLTRELLVEKAGGAGGPRPVEDMDGVRKGPDLRWWWNDKPIEDGLVAGAYTFRLGRPVFDWMEDSRPKEMPIGEPPFPYSEASAAKGERVYRELQCASCHGLEGRGDGPSAATTRGNLGEVVLPADYTKGFKGGSDPKDIVRTFMTGLHGTPMPSFARNFATPEAPWHLAHYVLRQARAR